MKKILVLGGTRFFGRKLVSKLIESGHDVTIGTRGRTDDPFGDSVKRLTIDRFDTSSLEASLSDTSWDVVYDQICFAPDDAADICRILDGRIGRYVLTSTGSVYPRDAARPYVEELFDPYNYPLVMGRKEKFTYGEGKRLSEAYFFQKASFPVAAMRIPVVVGTDDYTMRLADLVRFVRDRIPFRTPELELLIGFINSDEAADFLQWLGECSVVGPYNAAATGYLPMKDLIALIEKTVRRPAIMSDSEEQAPPLPGSSYLNNSKARTAGFEFSELMDWLPDLVKALGTEPGA